MSAGGYALETRKLCMRFGAIDVTRDVDLKIAKGARHALIGPNGAGKTTFINLVTGMFAPTGGAILLDGKDVTRTTPQHRVVGGMARTFQLNTLFNELTVAENIAIPIAQRLGASWRPWGRSGGDHRVTEELVSLMDGLNLLPRGRPGVRPAPPDRNRHRAGTQAEAAAAR
jgi:branched-chain amino acid transport system ATP-binding protein